MFRRSWQTLGILNGQIEIKGKVIATVVTGGNIDTARFCGLINQNSKN